MPNIKSAKKRVEVAAQNKQINKAHKSELATGLKKYNAFISAGDVEGAQKYLSEIVSLIDKSVTRGIIHKNKADKKKADLGTKLVKLQKTAKEVKAEVKAKEAVKEEKAAAVEEVKAPAKKRTTKKAADAAETEAPKKTVRKTTKKVSE